jgi:thiol-disulfide isomerase/thioredoxin
MSQAADMPKLSPAAVRVQELIKADKQASADFNKAYAEAKTDADRRKISATYGNKVGPDYFAPQFLALARQYSEDPAALDALGWMFRYASHNPQTAEAVTVLIPHWAADARLEPVCKSLTYLPCPAGDKLLRAAMEKSRDHNVQGLACYGLGASLRQQADRLTDRETAKRQSLEREAEQMFERVVAKYGDVKRNPTLKHDAEAELYVLRNLAIGKTAPEVEGEDVDGQRMRLSDYRGKVVLLVFWASWCGPCMADVPHEREIAQRYRGRSFAIVGVNGDHDRQAAQQACSKNEMSWRSFWSDKGSSGPIPSKWSVHSWPTLYVLDAGGVIRYKGPYLRRRVGEKEQDGKQHPVLVLDEALAALMGDGK